MFRLIFSVLTLSAIAVILVLTAGPSPTAEARFIRWDCSDWQPYPAVADADNELASSILETLAANRGKTLYCALDQSDTWTKRQVYDNAHAHNDRDRTQYDGSQGQGRFRGFTAGQEGWLTDGEAGITGVSPERIFEFPEQERGRRKTKILRKKVSSGPVEGNGCPDRGGYPNTGAVTTIRDLNPLGDLICTAYGNSHGSFNTVADSHARARNRYAGWGHGAVLQGFDWRTRARYTYTRANPAAWTYSGSAGGNSLSEAQWIAAAERAATAACAELGGGYKYEKGSADFGRGHNNNRAAGDRNHGEHHGWFYASWGNANPATHWRSRARESRTWSGVCFKKVRGSRRR